MTVQELEQYIADNNLKMDYRQGAGKFRDVYIGVGLPYDKLMEIRNYLHTKITCKVLIGTVTNSQHEDFNKSMVEIHSFWWE